MNIALLILGFLSLGLVLWAGLSLTAILAWRKIDTKLFGTAYE